MVSLLKKLNSILSDSDKVKLMILFVMMLFGTGFELLGIGTVMGFVALVTNAERIFEFEKIQPIFHFFGLEDANTIMVYAAVGLIGVFIVKNAYLIFYRYVQNRFVLNWYATVSSRLFTAYMNAPFSFHLGKNSADIIRNISTEVLYLANNIMLPLLRMSLESVVAVAVMILLFVIDPVITAIAIVFLGSLSFIFLKLIKKNMHSYGQFALRERANMLRTVNEGIGGIKESTVLNRQAFFVKRFIANVRSLAKAQLFQRTAKLSLMPITETISVSGLLLLVVILLLQGRSFAELLPLIALFVASTRRLLPAISGIVTEYNSLRYYAYSLDPICDDFSALSDVAIDEDRRKETMTKEMHLKQIFAVTNVSYVYPGTSQNVLNNISLAIEKGTAVGVVGSTGTGKTTLIDLMLGLLKAHEGQITIDGVDIHNDLSVWQKRIGYIPQFIFLSDDTIRNNIVFGLEATEIDEQALMYAVKAAQLYEFISQLPNGLDTVIGERGIRLSGGQRQRVGIARALYHNPEILIMDEATSSLDTITEKYVIAAIDELKKTRTIIIVAHRLTTVKNCDMLHIMKNGQIIASGTYDDLLQRSQDFQLMVNPVDSKSEHV